MKVKLTEQQFRKIILKEQKEDPLLKSTIGKTYEFTTLNPPGKKYLGKITSLHDKKGDGQPGFFATLYDIDDIDMRGHSFVLAIEGATYKDKIKQWHTISDNSTPPQTPFRGIIQDELWNMWEKWWSKNKTPNDQDTYFYSYKPQKRKLRKQTREIKRINRKR